MRFGEPMTDDRGNPVKYGDIVQSVESGWIGRVCGVIPSHNEPHGPMLVCVSEFRGELEYDDQQHFSPDDVIVVEE